ncbi:unnamed protein product [Lymnaea stagnalis]|uniref:IRS-type PTB domain-containing protein n=1 Tax=Lymnaea stagnalis TaxID=6523 RepID=A0AAV2IIE1_LYMST
MGCTYSGHIGKNDGTRSFRVYNVDDQGVELNRGTIEIRENDLVLYQKGKDTIRWPLRGLRRYGFDAELFSFESGRRCAMGPGIYAFKCSHAESLFNLVQESLQRAGEEDQRGQQQNHSHNTTVSGIQHNRGSASAVSEPVSQASERLFIYNGTTEDTEVTGSRNGSSHLYVNGILSDDSGHEYVNSAVTRANGGAFQIDETAALIDFLHNPPGVRSGATRSQVNYAELCMPDTQPSMMSMENLLDENGMDAVRNVERRMTGPDIRNRLSQHSLSLGGFGAESNNRISMPNDLLASSSQECILQSGDSDVFLPDVPQDTGASSNYVNIALEEPSLPARPPSQEEILLPPAHDALTNYANVDFLPSRVQKVPMRAPRVNKLPQVNYIVIDHKNQSNDNLPGNNSPTSPTSCVSFPESPSRKTESYAMIDFGRTAALSQTVRPVEDEGGRKTRHNSTISDMP